MKLFLLLFLFTSFTLFGQRDFSIEPKLTEFANDHGLYNKNLKKLESIRTNAKLSEEDRKIKWAKAYEKWDKTAITDSLCMEHIVQNYRFGTLRCSYLNHANTYPQLGQSLDYLLALTNDLVDQGYLSTKNATLLKNGLIHQIDNSEALQQDVQWLSKEYFIYFQEARVTNAQVKMIVEFFADSSVDIEQAIAKIKFAKQDKFDQLEALVNLNGISYNDLLFSIYEREDRFNGKFSFQTNTLPRFQIGQPCTAMSDHFGHMMYGTSNLSNCGVLDFIQYAPYLENDTVANVALFKLIFDRWYEFRALQTAPQEQELLKPISNKLSVQQAEIVDFPDVSGEFPGGSKAFIKWIDEHMIYPEISKKLGDQGRVYVTFIVEIDGSISEIEVMRGGVSEELNAEAIRLIRSMPKWKPSESGGKRVRARFRAPVTFVLD